MAPTNKPTSVAVSNITCQGMDVSWLPGAGGADYYTVQIVESLTDDMVGATNTAEQTPTSTTSVTTGQTIFFTPAAGMYYSAPSLPPHFDSYFELNKIVYCLFTF